jgi:hypothetical protein
MDRCERSRPKSLVSNLPDIGLINLPWRRLGGSSILPSGSTGDWAPLTIWLDEIGALTGLAGRWAAEFWPGWFAGVRTPPDTPAPDAVRMEEIPAWVHYLQPGWWFRSGLRAGWLDCAIFDPNRKTGR